MTELFDGPTICFVVEEASSRWRRHSVIMYALRRKIVVEKTWSLDQAHATCDRLSSTTASLMRGVSIIRTVLNKEGDMPNRR